MVCEMHEVFYLKETELKLLLAGLGVSGWYGLFSEKDLTEREMKNIFHQILAELYQKDVINWKEDQISVKKPYSDMFSIMMAQKKCVTIQMKDAEHPTRCCYIDKADVVITQKSQREKNTLLMERMSASDWMRSVEDEIRSLEDGQRLLLVCRDSRNGQTLDCMQICQKGIRAYLEDRVLYQKGALREKLEIWREPSFPEGSRELQEEQMNDTHRYLYTGDRQQL